MNAKTQKIHNYVLGFATIHLPGMLPILTTSFGVSSRFKRQHPKLILGLQRIFTSDGNVWMNRVLDKTTSFFLQAELSRRVEYEDDAKS